MAWSPATHQDVQDRIWRGSLGFPTTVPMVGVSPSGHPLDARIYYCRAFGSGTITKIRVQVVVQSGNISLGIYTGGTVGLASAVPGVRKATTGSVACPAVGLAEVSLTASVDVDDGDWFAICADNNTAQFYMVGNGSGANEITAGRMLYDTAGAVFPLPSSPSSYVTNYATLVTMMDGVA